MLWLKGYSLKRPSETFSDGLFLFYVLTVKLRPFFDELNRFFFHALLLRFLLVSVVAHFLRDFHRTEFGAAHRAEVGDFRAFGGQGFVVKALGAFGVEA